MQDLYATKGTEYLVVIVYLLVFAAAAAMLALPRIAERLRSRARTRTRRRLRLPSPAPGYAFHPGHAWVGEPDCGVVAVGLDEFTAMTIGDPDGFELPPAGSTLRQGGPGWAVRAGGRALRMLSPVEGEVVAVNPVVLKAPAIAGSDPYGEGWLLKVRAPGRQVWLPNLLSGELASVWMRNAVERLGRTGTAELGQLLQDGGAPARGFARSLGEEEWKSLAREFFLAS